MLKRIACILLLLYGSAWGDNIEIIGVDAVGMYDAKLQEAWPHYNYGDGDLASDNNLNERLFLFRCEVDTIGVGQEIDSMSISLYCTTENDATIGMFEVFKPWYEGSSNGVNEPGACDAICWYDSDSTWWGTTLDSASDAGSQNRSSGSGWDRTATAMDSEAVTTVSQWYTFWVDTALAQDWYDGSKDNFGVVFIETTDVGITVFSSSESGSNPPKVTIYYSAVGGGEWGRKAQIF